MKKRNLFKQKFLFFILSLVFFVFLSQHLFAHENVNIHFTGMGLHLNQNLYLRVVNKGTMKETARTEQLISSADLDIVISAVDVGRSYFIDFFADVNSNAIYDVPPADHAWRLELDSAVGNDELDFSHNTNFTDIDWAYQVVVHFTGMNPHLNQMLELRLENDNTNPPPYTDLPFPSGRKHAGR